MADDPSRPCVLMSAANDVEAAAIVTALASYDVRASTTGSFTAGLKAEAPGDVQVIVRQCDLDRAKLALGEIRRDQGQVDWSTIDVGEPSD
jgi:hypothetical protein